MRKIAGLISKYKLAILFLFIAITGVLFYFAINLPVRITLEKFFPYDHPFVKLNRDLGSQFGGTNTMLVMVKNKSGSIYNTKTIGAIRQATDFFYYKKYVARSLTASITLNKSKYTLGKGMGVVESAPLFPPDFDNTQKSFDFVKKMITTSPVFNGLLVADDGSAGMVIVEIDESVDYDVLRKEIATLKSSLESDGTLTVSFTGRPALMSYIYDLSKNIYLLVGIVILIAIVILYYFFRDIYGVSVVLIVAAFCSIWGLGFMSLLKFELSPLMLILPVLISTRAISHSIQLHARFVEEVALNAGNKDAALENTFYSMLVPNISAVSTDAVGFFILYLIKIGLLQEIAISMGIWVTALIPLSGIMMPILCTYFPIKTKEKNKASGISLDGVAHTVGAFSTKKTGTVIVGGFVALMLAFSLYYAPKIKIGDAFPGSSLLFPNSVYNTDTKNINNTFSKAGADGLTLFFQGGNDSIKKPETLKYLDRFERYMVNHIDVASGAWSLGTVLKNINAGLHDGDPKWDFIPDDQLLSANLVQVFGMKNDPSEFARYTDPMYKIGNTVVFFKNHVPETIKNVEQACKEFFKENPTDSKYGKFYFAGGSIGLEMAVNQVVTSSHQRIDLLILIAVLFMCVASYRSFVAAIVLVFPLIIANLFVTALMVVMGIGITIDTLPVVAIGVGIGVDFGIYLMSRMQEEMAVNANNYDISLDKALLTTGQSILFSGITMILPLIIIGYISEIKFQSQMSTLIGLILFINMAWAITVQPIIIRYLKPKFLLSTAKSKEVIELSEPCSK